MANRQRHKQELELELWQLTLRSIGKPIASIGPSARTRCSLGSSGWFGDSLTGLAADMAGHDAATAVTDSATTSRPAHSTHGAKDRTAEAAPLGFRWKNCCKGRATPLRKAKAIHPHSASNARPHKTFLPEPGEHFFGAALTLDTGAPRLS
jgi:hypothetical protein